MIDAMGLNPSRFATLITMTSHATSYARSAELFDDSRPLTDRVDQAFSVTDGPLKFVNARYTERQAQIELANEVAKAIETQTTLVAEAGTGTGKTFAYLMPALLSGKKILISTATKTLQEQLFHKDIPALLKALKLFSPVALLKGRANYLCPYRLHVMESDEREQFLLYQNHLQKQFGLVQRFAKKTQTGDRAECVGVPESDEIWKYVTSTRETCKGKNCPSYESCYLKKAREQALQAQIVVVNHHLLLGSMSLRKTSSIEGILPKAHVVVIDEAHQLANITSNFLTQSVSSRPLMDAIHRLRELGPMVQKDLPWTALYKHSRQQLLELGVVLFECGLEKGRRCALDDLKNHDKLLSALVTVQAWLGFIDFVLTPLVSVESDEDTPTAVEELTRAHVKFCDANLMIERWVQALRLQTKTPATGDLSEALFEGNLDDAPAKLQPLLKAYRDKRQRLLQVIEGVDTSKPSVAALEIAQPSKVSAPMPTLEASERLDSSVDDMLAFFGFDAKTPVVGSANANDSLISEVAPSEVTSAAADATKPHDAVANEQASTTTATPTDAIWWAQNEGDYFVLHYTPLDVSQDYQNLKNQDKASWIYTSATLSTNQEFKLFRNQLGELDDSVREGIWPSPFNYWEQGCMFLPMMPEPDRNSRQHILNVIDASWPIMRAAQGRTFLLCTSLGAVQSAAQRIRQLIKDENLPFEVLVQNEAPKGRLIQQFVEHGHAILIGSMSFWEGVDIQGSALSLVVIDRIPFTPPDDPVLKARSLALKERGIDPFSAVSLPDAIIKLKQGVGRLIRSEADLGMIIIGDTRLATKAYGRRILNSLPDFFRTRDVQVAIDFFENRARYYQSIYQGG